MNKVRSAQAPRRALKTTAWGVVVTLGAALLVSVGLPLTSVFFAPESLEACTVSDRSDTPRARRGGSLFPRVHTDCGVFRLAHASRAAGDSLRATKQASCTADPALHTPLIPGHTYNLEVRGVHLPFIPTREIVSASVSPHQNKGAAASAEDVELLDLNTDNELLNEQLEAMQNRPESKKLREKLDGFRAESAPEVLRAFDYEQPAFVPECDVSRLVMTSKGLQLMDPARAAKVLELPPGESARDPRLPCEGYRCDRPVSQRP